MSAQSLGSPALSRCRSGNGGRTRCSPAAAVRVDETEASFHPSTGPEAHLGARTSSGTARFQRCHAGRTYSGGQRPLAWNRADIPDGRFSFSVLRVLIGASRVPDVCHGIGHELGCSYAVWGTLPSTGSGRRGVSIPQTTRVRLPEPAVPASVGRRSRLAHAVACGLVHAQPGVERLEPDAERLGRAALVPVQLRERRQNQPALDLVQRRPDLDV